MTGIVIIYVVFAYFYVRIAALTVIIERNYVVDTDIRARKPREFQFAGILLGLVGLVPLLREMLRRP